MLTFLGIYVKNIVQIIKLAKDVHSHELKTLVNARIEFYDNLFISTIHPKLKSSFYLHILDVGRGDLVVAVCLFLRVQVFNPQSTESKQIYVSVSVSVHSIV